MYGKDYEYADTRLAGTIVRLVEDGEPVYVYRILNDGSAHCERLSNKGDVFLTKLDNLDVKPVPLGWCNLNKVDATYLTRIPLRRDWRQGLRKESCYSSNRIFEQISWSSLAMCIKGDYPPAVDVFRNKTRRVVAWCRDWASDGHFLFYKKGQRVGEVIVDGKLKLFEEFNYLQESLEESL